MVFGDNTNIFTFLLSLVSCSHCDKQTDATRYAGQKDSRIARLVVLGFLLAACTVFLSGCGVVPGIPPRSVGALNLAAAANTVSLSQTITVEVTAIGAPLSTVSLGLQCSAAQCGKLNGNLYTAPSTMPPAATVTITARSSVANITPAALQLTIVPPPPPPSITSITPRVLPPGIAQSVTITGTGFIAGSSVQVTSNLNGAPAVLNSTNVVSTSSIVVSLTTPPNETGSLAISVQGPLSSSSPVTLTVGLPVFNVGTYGASGSAETYTCSGQAGSYVLTCNQSALDFQSTQGIRIVGGGGPVRVPPITVQPVIHEVGAASGHHNYCYVISAADLQGGLTSPSPQNCINNEPDLSFTTAYNWLGGTYQYPAAAFLWYVSKDGGPFRLVTVGSEDHAAQDVGQQPGSRGGWPLSLPVGDPDISKDEDQFTSVASVSGNRIVLSDPLTSSVVDAVVDHDDTGSIQTAINAAAAVGGGVIQFNDGVFNVRRPAFATWPNNSAQNAVYTTSYALAPWYAGFQNLYLISGSTGNIYFDGDGASTVIQTVPDYAGNGFMFAFGGGVGNPAFPPFTAIKILPVDKGATAIVLADDTDANTLHAGDDIWLYSGSFGGTCIDSNGSAGGNCHFSELNSIKAISGTTIALEYPTSKKYYDDGVDSFGMVKLPVTVHNIAIENLTFNTYNPVVSAGLLYGLLVDHVTVNGSQSNGAFNAGFKRDVLIENSSWGMGIGDTTWDSTEEFDQATNIAFINNVITGYGAPGAEGPSEGARIYLTEGTSQAYFEGNTFNHLVVSIQDTTDDIIRGNQFNDAFVSVGNNYNAFKHGFLWGGFQDTSLLSFGSQETADIDNNTFNIDSGYGPPWVIQLGHFKDGKVYDNIINYDGAVPTGMIDSDGGEIKGNKMTIGRSTRQSIGIVVIPDEGPGLPPSGFDVEDNVVNAGSVMAGIYGVNTGFADTAPVCIKSNTINIQSGQTQSVADTIGLSCDGMTY